MAYLGVELAELSFSAVPGAVNCRCPYTAGFGWERCLVSGPVTAPGKIRFGGEFELDLASYKLRRHGLALKLERIPFEILISLVQRQGEIVTREQIVERIWGKDVFLDTDNSINGAIRKIRQVLRDDSEEPRFIQTVTGHGYRFIASIAIEDPRAVAFENAASEIEAQAEPASQPPAWRYTKRWSWIVAAAISAVLIAGGFFFWRKSETTHLATPQRLMLAVLPFQNLTGDAGAEYLVDGLTEEMITQLGNLDPQHLGVIARTSVMHYKASQTALDQIGRELGVQYVIEGSVRRDAETVRITAQLIQMKDQSHIWARQYDRELKGLLTLQGEIAQEIADEIQLTLNDRKPGVAQKALSPQNFEAYDLYLKGQYFFNKRTVAGLEEAIRYFQQATNRDPNFARSYAGLADSYALMPGYSGLPQGKFMNQARAAALKALAIDQNLPEAHAALALIVQNYDWDWETSEKEFRRAIELNPNYATAHHWFAEHLMWRGRFDEALQESERARQLDPLSLIIAADNGAILYYSRQYDRAIEKWRSVLEMDPDFPRAGLIAVAYAEKGMAAEALAAVEKRRPSDSAPPWWYWSLKAYIYARSGQTLQARQALDQLLQSNRRSPIDPRIVAWNYAALGDKERAFAFLEKAYVQHSTELVSLKVNPAYDSLRSDPRYQDLLRRVGLAE